MGLWLWLVVGLFAVVFLAFLSSFFALAVTRVPVLRTPAELLDGIRDALQMRDDQVLVDAGCADARTLVALCRGSRVRGRGYELNGPVWLAARLRVLLTGNAGRIRIAWKDFFRTELEDVDVVYCYLMPGVMERVAGKCEREMRPGGRLVSFLWSVPGWRPVETLRLGRLSDPVYIYRVPPLEGVSDQSQENDRSKDRDD